MAALLFISGGLFLGWILGAKNMSTIFGTAVATKMVKFRVAALVAGIFVVSGVILQGSGGATTIANLGSVDALGGAFTIALCTGMTILALGYYGMPSSITQAIVGAILGWCFFTKTGIEYNHLTTIITCWVTGPLAGFVLAPLLFLLLRFYLRKSRLHILKLDFYLRTALLVAGAFASYSLGANNIGNVAGVFVSAIPELSMNVGSLPVNGIHLLLFLCGIAVAAGIASYGKKRIEAKGNGIKELTPEAAIIVVFTQGLILFVFSSQQLLNIFHSFGLPSLPLVPLSISQVAAGSILGISLLKGVGEVRFKSIGTLLSGWILSPLIAFFATYFSLFIVQNVFRIVVTNRTYVMDQGTQNPPANSIEPIHIPISYNIVLSISSIILICLIGLLVYLQIKKFQISIHAQNEKRKEESHFNEMHKALTDIEVKTIQLENSALATRLQEKKNEVVNFALNISEQRKFLDMLAGKIEDAYREEEHSKRREILKETLTSLHQKMSFSQELENLYLKAEKVHNDFPARITEKFPDLTEQEKRLTLLLRVGFSSKEISSIMNISPKSVEISRYRLRKKLNIDNKVNLTSFIKNI